MEKNTNVRLASAVPATLIVWFTIVSAGCLGLGDLSSDCLGKPDTCGERCASLQSDWLNCGVCGHVCAGGETCQGGNCVVMIGNDDDGFLSDLADAGQSDGNADDFSVALPPDLATLESSPPDLAKSPPDLSDTDSARPVDMTGPLPDLAKSPPDLWKCNPSDPSGCGGNCPERCVRGKVCAAPGDCAEAFCDRAICGAIKLSAAGADLDCFPVDRVGNRKGGFRTVKAGTTGSFPDPGADFATQCSFSQGGGGIMLRDIAGCDGPVSGPHAPFQTGFGNGCKR